VECIVTQFVLDEKIYQNTGCYAYSQADDVDEGIELLLEKVAKRNFQVILKHEFSPVL
jgi:hypothetical protein